MKKSEVWLELFNSTISSANFPCSVKEVGIRTDALIKEFENRFGDVYDPERNNQLPAEKDFSFIPNELEKISYSNKSIEDKVFEAFQFGLSAVMDSDFCEDAFKLCSEKNNQIKG